MTEPGGPLVRVDCQPETLERDLARLVLGLIELVRQLMERQAVRRLEGGHLSDAQVESMGTALMNLELKVQELAEQFGLRPEDLNLGVTGMSDLLPGDTPRRSSEG